MQLLKAADSLLLVVDMQEKLLPLINAHEELITHCAWLIRLANTLEIPVFISEQYPHGLGPTATALRSEAANAASLAKTEFSCASNPPMLAAINHYQRQQIVICGIETHVCVLQTAIELANQDKQIFVVTDATSTRHLEDKFRALERLSCHPNIQLITREMVLFEWLHHSATPLFKEVSQKFLKEQ